MTYRPLPSVPALAMVPVARLRTATLAPGTIAPEGSVTTPPMAPSVVDCPKERGFKPNKAASTTTQMTKTLMIERSISFILINHPPQRTRAASRQTYTHLRLSRGKGWLPSGPKLINHEHRPVKLHKMTL